MKESYLLSLQKTNISEEASSSPSPTPQIFTELTPKSSSLGFSPVTENLESSSSESPIKITTIRFNYPFLASDLSTPSTLFLETSETKMNSLESTTSYGVGGHARPHATDEELIKLTPPPGESKYINLFPYRINEFMKLEWEFRATFSF